MLIALVSLYGRFLSCSGFRAFLRRMAPMFRGPRDDGEGCRWGNQVTLDGFLALAVQAGRSHATSRRPAPLRCSRAASR